MDRNKDGMVSFDEFQARLNNEVMYSFAESLELVASDLKQFFWLLSNGGKVDVDIDTCVVGCIKMKGMQGVWTSRS